MLLIIGLSFWNMIRSRIWKKKRLYRAALYGLPLPRIAIESGWFIAEYDRQSWAIGEVLPTAIANSSLTAGNILFSMGLICGLYTLFLVAEMYLMFKFVRLEPSSLKTLAATILNNRLPPCRKRAKQEFTICLTMKYCGLFSGLWLEYC
ncbi:cytochrome ubiquinol oxidase subunit I [Serratia symbiotica]|nr:cytochrome ubiquinol oxidase subunit I [Serratia symbiotica]